MAQGDIKWNGKSRLGKQTDGGVVFCATFLSLNVSCYTWVGNWRKGGF